MLHVTGYARTVAFFSWTNKTDAVEGYTSKADAGGSTSYLSRNGQHAVSCKSAKRGRNTYGSIGGYGCSFRHTGSFVTNSHAFVSRYKT